MTDFTLADVTDAVQRTLQVIRDSDHIQTSVSDEVDRISIVLSRSSAEIGEILNAALITHSVALSDECVTNLGDLHICLTHMVIEWESRHLQISDRRFGRPRISINISLIWL